VVFTRRLRDGVRRGTITCSVRVWTHPHVKVGGRYRMDDGEIEIDSIEKFTRSKITNAMARRSGFADVADLMDVAQHGKGKNIYLIEFRYSASFLPRLTPTRAKSKR
jgi:hypothetical protein